MSWIINTITSIQNYNIAYNLRKADVLTTLFVTEIDRKILAWSGNLFYYAMSG